MSSISRPRVCSNLLTSAKIQFSTSSVQSKSHYDTLGISSKATQNDIKSAYYKLTKMYHPDKNKSEEAKLKFRSVTDAYEILGNYKARRMYDRGMRPGIKYTDNRDPETKRKEDAQTRFYKSRLIRNQVPAADGRTPIYDFDEWSKAHYGEIFDQNRKAKATTARYEQYRVETQQDQNNYRAWIPITLILFMVSTMMYTSSSENNYDKNKLTSDEKEPKST